MQSSRTHSLFITFLEQHNILTDSQHGFRARRSYGTQLISTIEGIAKQLKSGKNQVDVIVLDFAKAFDKAQHCRLLNTLNHYGIRDENLKWIKSFLENRTEQVV